MGLPALDLGTLWFRFYEQPKTASGNWRQINPTIQGQGNLSIFNRIGQSAMPKPRPNMPLENKGWPIEWSGPHTHQHTFFLRRISVIFEDNEAVIKTIINGWSPTMRQVSRTHRVALDWLFDRINVDTKIQIKYVDTKHQLADMLTKGNFTRDEWNNFLHLLNISHFSSTCCTKNFSLMSCSTMAKRIQNQKGRRESCVQVATSSDEYFFFYCDKSLHHIESDCIWKSWDADSLGETPQQDECWTELIRRNVDVSSATKGCIPWRVDGRPVVRPVASRRRKFRRLRQFCGWNLALPRRTCCPKQ